MHLEGAQPKSAATAETRLVRGLTVALPLFVLIVFLPAFDVSFAQDDFARLNRALRGGSWHSDFAARFGVGLNRPVLEAYFEFLVHLFGISVTAFHLVAFGLHTLNAYLLARLARSLGLTPRSAILAGYFYGGHAALLTALMWPSAASSILVVTFSLLALNLNASGLGPWRHLPALACLALALLTREIAVAIAPAIAFLNWSRFADAGVSSGRAVTRALVDALPYALLVALYVYVSRAGHAHLSGAESSYAMGLGRHVAFNSAYLGAVASGLLVSRDAIVLGAQALLFWILIGRAALAALREGSSLPVAGIAVWAAGILPMVLLVNQREYAYYSDVALLGMALAVATLADHAKCLSGSKPLLLALVLWGSMASVSTRLEFERSPVRIMSERSERVSGSVLQCHPSLPRRARILIESEDVDNLQWVTGFGELFRMLYRDPKLRVDYIAPGEQPPADDYEARLRIVDYELEPTVRGR